MKKIDLLFLISCLLLSCRESPDFDAIVLKTPIALSATEVDLPIDLYRPSKLLTCGDKIAVFDDTKEQMFKVFNLADFCYLYSFGNIGPGPDEFTFIDKESLNYSRQLEFVDHLSLKTVALADSTAKVNTVCFLSFEEEKEIINSLKRVNDSIYVSDNLFNDTEYELKQINIKSETSVGFSDKPDWDQSLKNKDEERIAYGKSICTHPYNGKKATFYYHYPMLRIYSETNEQLKQICVGDKLPDIDWDNRQIYFTESYSTANNLYVMWINKSKEEVEKDMDNFRPEILVFDWDGNLKAHYKLDQPVITFAVQRSELYAVSFMSMNTVYRYKLPSLLEEDGRFLSRSNKQMTFDIFSNYVFSTNDEVSLNNWDKTGNYKINTVYLGQGDNRIYEDLGAISVSCVLPDGVPEIEMRTFLDHLKNRKQREPDFYQEKSSFKVGARIVYPVQRKYIDRDPKTQKEVVSYSNSFYFKDNEKMFFVLDISSRTKNIDKYKTDLIQIIASISNRNK